jgi:hypothetical protein
LRIILVHNSKRVWSDEALVFDFARRTIARGEAKFLMRGNRFRVALFLVLAQKRRVAISDFVDFVYGDCSEGGPYYANSCINKAIHYIKPQFLQIGLELGAYGKWMQLEDLWQQRIAA